MKLQSKVLLSVLLPFLICINAVVFAHEKPQTSSKEKENAKKLKSIKKSLPAYKQNLSQARTPEHWQIYAYLTVNGLLTLASKDYKDSNFREVIIKLEPTLPLLKKLDYPELQTSVKGYLAYAYTRLGEYDKALPLYEELLSLTQTTDYSTHEAYDRILLAKIYLYKKDYIKSESLLTETLTQVNQQDMQAAGVLKELGTLKLVQKDFIQAETYTQKALKLVQEKEGEDSFLTIAYLQDLGLVYIAQKRYQEAECLYRHALKITKGKTQQLEALTSYNNIGLIYHAQGDFEKAQAYYRKAQKLLTKTGANPDSPFYIRIKIHLDEIAKKLPPTYIWDS